MRQLKLVLALAALSGGVPRAAVSGQELPQLFPGVSVQLPGRFTGVLTRVTPDTLFLLTNAGVNVALPRAALDTILVAGQPDRLAGARKGALIGGGIGVVLGAVAWIGGFREDTGGWYDDEGRKAGPGDAALLAGIGVLGGALYGAAKGWQRWVPVSAGPGAVSVAVLPQRGVSLSLRLR